MRCTWIVLVAAACSFQHGRLGGGDSGVDPTGDGALGDSADPDAPDVAPRSCTFHLGSDHSCSVRTSDGTIHCAGYNGFGELGRGAAGGASTTVMQVSVGATTSASSRSYHACIAKPDGSAQCWGYNDGGQIGDGTGTTRPAPTTVMNLANVVEVAVGRSFSCARRSDDTVTCWGANSAGQLGDGTNTPRTSPATTVMGLTLPPIAISAGSSSACALLTNGTAACWGRNEYGQLGDGSQTDRETAVATPLTSIKQIAPSGYSTGEGAGGQTCALLTSGAVWCWGSNNFGQLGNGTTSTSPSLAPVQLSITGAVEISLGRHHACARHGADGGTVSCWGHGTLGEIGDGGGAHRSSPTVVTLPRPAVHVVAGGFHTCALLDDDSVRCWGLNTSGQLADGGFSTRLSPVMSSLCP